MFHSRIDFDDSVKSKLKKTIEHMKKNFFDISQNRDEIAQEEYGNYGWMVDFQPDSVINVRLRKTDKLNFALNNEGNLYNNLINKVISRENYPCSINIHIFFIFCFRWMKNSRMIVQIMGIIANSMKDFLPYYQI